MRSPIALGATLCALFLLAGCGDDDSGETTTTTGAGTTQETERVPLAAVTDPSGAEGETMILSRVTIVPGDSLDPHFHEGTQIAFIDAGVLTYSVIEGEVPVMAGSPEDDPELVREIKAGESAEIEAGQWLIEEEADVHEAANEGDVPVEITLASLLDSDADPSTPAKG